MDTERASDECDLCGRELSTPGVENDEGVWFCSNGCRDVRAELGGAPERRGSDSATEPIASGGGDDQMAETVGRTFLRIDSMYSATCEAFLEAVAEGIEGVIDAEASYVTETIRVEHDLDRVTPEALREALSTLGYTAYLREQLSRDAKLSESATRRSRETAGMRKRRDDQILGMRYAVGLLFGSFLLIPYVAIIYPTHLAAMFEWEMLQIFKGAFQLGGRGGLIFLRLYFVFTGIILFFTGLPVLRGAFISLKMRRPNTDLLVAGTTMSAYAYSTIAVLLGRNDIYFDLAIVVAAAVTAAVFYESSVKQRALERLTELTVSQVDSAQVYNDDGTTSEVAVEDISPGDRVLARQGDRIPVDGVLAEGSCIVDEAVVTGESLPVSKRAGETVVGGSIVTDDAAIVEVGTDATSTIDRITTAVWDLQSADHGVQRHADQMAARVVGVLVMAAILLAVAAVALGAEFSAAVLVSLSVVLVGSPWALGLSTPLSVATSLEAALRRGIVVFDETVFERLRDIDVVVFDKTGTLTTGTMDVIDADAPPDLLAAAAKLEHRASHPAASAIAAAFSASDETESSSVDGGDGETPAGQNTTGIQEFTSHANGIEGVVEGTEVLVGNLDLFADHEWEVDAEIESQVDEARGFGRLPVVVGREGTAEGLVVVGDEPRKGWDDTITRLGRRGIDVVVLTGDDEEAADFFSRHEFVTHAFANVPPAGKTATIRQLETDGEVAMVGDGTNDAPALAAADLGISLGSGTALAADAADITIEHDRIESVEVAFDLAAAAGKRIRQNNKVALLYNGIAITAVIGGVFNPLTAGIAVIASGGLLAANSWRALLES